MEQLQRQTGRSDPSAPRQQHHHQITTTIHGLDAGRSQRHRTGQHDGLIRHGQQRHDEPRHGPTTQLQRGLRQPGATVTVAPCGHPHSRCRHHTRDIKPYTLVMERGT
eukprot:SAG11_NODE_5820_length_1456_cov_21.042004_1_plen_107_part_10